MLTRSEDASVLFGLVLIAALFPPSGYSKLMAFSSFAISVASKGVPYPEIAACLLVAAEFRRHALADTWPIDDGAGLPYPQNVEFCQNLAIIGGLLMYFACGPGVWSETSLR